MFANDYHGDCVIAGRAHQTLRFEDKEQNKMGVLYILMALVQVSRPAARALPWILESVQAS
jgi:hypothetical protein